MIKKVETFYFLSKKYITTTENKKLYFQYINVFIFADECGRQPRRK